MRHAKAEERDSTLYPDDSKRPLSQEGMEQAKKAAEGLKRAGLKADRIFSSPYKRAKQTAEIVASTIGYTGKLIFTDAICPDSDFEGLKKLILNCKDGESVLFVSHEPFLGYSAAEILTGRPDTPLHFKTAAICRLEITSRDPLRGKA